MMLIRHRVVVNLEVEKRKKIAEPSHENPAIVAEREGFEPSVELPLRVLSKDVVSATHPSLQRDSK